MGLARVGLAFSSKAPNLKLKEVVKNVDLQKPIDRGIADITDTYDVTDTSISNLKDLFAKNQPLMEQYTGEAVSNIDKIMGGQLGNQLAQLRNKQYAARMGATERTLDRITAQNKASRARRGITGGSSYDDLMYGRVMSEAAIPAELERVALERGDLAYERDMKLANAQTRQGLLSGLEQREMQLPGMVSTLRSVPLANLGILQKLDDQNKFRALWEKKGFGQKLADADDEFLNTIGQIASIVGSLYGGGGGGNVRQSAPPSFSQMPTTGAPPSGGYGGAGMGGMSYGAGGYYGAAPDMSTFQQGFGSAMSGIF